MIFWIKIKNSKRKINQKIKICYELLSITSVNWPILSLYFLMYSPAKYLNGSITFMLSLAEHSNVFIFKVSDKDLRLGGLTKLVKSDLLPMMQPNNTSSIKTTNLKSEINQISINYLSMASRAGTTLSLCHTRSGYGCMILYCWHHRLDKPCQR